MSNASNPPNRTAPAAAAASASAPSTPPAAHPSAASASAAAAAVSASPSAASLSSSSSSIVRNDRAELILIGTGIDTIEQNRWTNELGDNLIIAHSYKNDLNNCIEPLKLYPPNNNYPEVKKCYDPSIIPHLPVNYRWNTELSINQSKINLNFFLNQQQLSLPDEAKEEKQIAPDSSTIFSGSIMEMMKKQKDRTDIDNIKYWPWKKTFTVLYDEGEILLKLLNNNPYHKRYDIIITQFFNQHIIGSIQNFFASKLGSLINDKKNKYEVAVNECKEKIEARKICMSNGEYIQAATIQTDYLKLIDKSILPLNRELRAVIEGGLQEHAIQERLSNALASFSEAINKQIEKERHLGIIDDAHYDSKTLVDARQLVNNGMDEKKQSLDKEIHRLSKDRELAVFNIQCDAVKPASEKAAKSKNIDYLITIDNEIENRRCAHRLLGITADRWMDAGCLYEEQLKKVIKFHKIAKDIYDASLLFARRVIEEVLKAIRGLIDDLRSNMEQYEREACHNFNILYVETNTKLWQWEQQMEEKNNKKKTTEAEQRLYAFKGDMKAAADAKNRSNIIDIEMSELKININTLKADEESLKNTNNLLLPLYRKYSIILPDAAYKEEIGQYTEAITLAQKDLAASLSNNRLLLGGGYMERNALPPAL